MRPAIAVGIASVGLLVAAEALARVGGGEGFSTGRGGGGSHGSGFSGGGGGGGDLDILFLLIRLAIEYPAIGVPLLVVAVGVMAWRARQAGPVRLSIGRPAVSRPPTGPRPPAPPRRARVSEVMKSLDPGFSLPVLLDFLQLVHRRATEAAASRAGWEALVPFVSPEARRSLEELHRDVRGVSEVVLGGATLVDLTPGKPWFQLTVAFQDTRVERTEAGERRVYVEERWVFRRAAGATSLPPEEMVRLGCPSCGSAAETDNMGRCRSCSTPIARGELQWQAAEVRFTLARRPVEAPRVGPAQGGEEPGYRAPIAWAPDLDVQLRGLVGRHPDFKLGAFRGRVESVFRSLQSAWSDGEWSRARPYVTDSLYQTLRFWMEKYTAAGLHNRLGDVSFHRLEIVRVETDAWYEAITVRLWASARDWVEDAQGRVVGGNDRTARQFSEYWTFIRAIGTGAASRDSARCPSCGAPLDRVSQTGVCGYCDTKITSGRHDWVLSRIEQPEVYGG